MASTVRSSAWVLAAASFFGFALTTSSALKADFSPWTVMGMVDTAGQGSVEANFTGSALNYSVSLYNLTGLRSIEIHIGDPSMHGDVVAVLCATAFPNATSVSNGLTCAGSLDQDGLLGPLLLPEGYHLEVSVLYERYIMTGLSTVVVHTLGNPGGELGASFAAMEAPGMAPSSEHMSHGMGMPLPRSVG